MRTEVGKVFCFVKYRLFCHAAFNCSRGKLFLLLQRFQCRVFISPFVILLFSDLPLRQFLFLPQPEFQAVIKSRMRFRYRRIKGETDIIVILADSQPVYIFQCKEGNVGLEMRLLAVPMVFILI